jgi:hypothetical protein
MPSEDLTHSIDRWDDDGRELIEYIAKAKTFEVAVAAYDAAVKADPHSFIRMSHPARVLRERKAIPWKP